ncbi:N-acetylglutamate synthase [Lindgomyces ingoldianus]|uniref:N-acetylglutamate synthase n=1 Tax=Lindgomyces ingoldianus TaxID=673940 RepID=A0ACB6R9L2_9PLEO|nr:N-acetylglutamate synthase [Lindgomyces ingoldianus]KAF2475876.1 N-acetylglutamate synthase [Lindgomyces ingoldianus]
MIVCQKAQCRGLGRTTVKALPKYDGICKLNELPHMLPFSTTAPSLNSGTEPPRNARYSSAKERQRAERDQLIKSLKESPGKRDARNFLKHFDTPKKVELIAAPGVERVVSDFVGQAHHSTRRLDPAGVNLGNLYEPAKAIQESPVFIQQSLTKELIPENVEPLHIALVKLRQPQELDDEKLRGIALTLSQMVRLGMNIAVVVDCDEDAPEAPLVLSPAWEQTVREQISRIVDALAEFNEPGVFEIDHALSISNIDTPVPSTVQVQGGVEVKSDYLLLPLIEEGIIPVLPSIAYDADVRKVRVDPDDVVLALTRKFAGITAQKVEESEPDKMCEKLYQKSKPITDKPILDRIIILDPRGGIPHENRIDGAHVFINLEAEYRDVKNDLKRFSSTFSGSKRKDSHSPSGDSNPISKFAESEIPSLATYLTKHLPGKSLFNRHMRNLDVVQRALKLLPPSSSALIITPTEAAASSQTSVISKPPTEVRTRRSKNPLIHNLLTDKPMVSSSLPAPFVTRPVASTAPNPPTFLKKGIPVTMIPDPRISGPWQPPSLENPSIELENDPQVNFPKLVDLIDDSFRRKLDVKHYLDRIRGRVAGIIIAGNYEGGAICTWETPPPLPSSESKTHINTSTLPPDSPVWIPYLDKFAVLTSSQGSGGVADIVWGALTRSCFPHGLVWRSRSSNPVNKWYFERAVGMWNLPGGQWTMFWTTEGVVEEWAERQKSLEDARKRGEDSEKGWKGDMTRWDAYVRVCGGVAPSWADGKRPD